MSWATRAVFVLALFAALVFTGVASADISGTAKGIELPQGDGIYTLQGTWTDSDTGTNGTYTGTLHNSGDYTTCVPPAFGCQPWTPPEFQHCNVPSGTITFRARGAESVVINIVPMFPISFLNSSFICLDLNDPSLHHVEWLLQSFTAPVLGFISGTSTEAGTSGVFLDEFSDFSLRGIPFP
jgi:hypothetical protein